MTNILIQNLPDKVTPVDADSVPIVNSVGSVTSKVTWANIKATLKTYFDTLYLSISTASSTYVPLATYDANTILAATADNTPVALTVGTNTVVGRVAGSITTLTIDNDLTSVSASDDTVPSAKATKTYADTKAPTASPTFTGTVTAPSIKGTLTSDTDGATITFDKNISDYHNVVLGGNRTLALSNMAVGDRIVLRLVQDGTGTRTVTWFTTIKWTGGTVPTLTTTINKADMFGFLCTSASNYDGFIIGQNI